MPSERALLSDNCEGHIHLGRNRIIQRNIQIGPRQRITCDGTICTHRQDVRAWGDSLQRNLCCGIRYLRLNRLTIQGEKDPLRLRTYD